MANNKLLTALFSIALATGTITSGCISKSLYESINNNDTLAINALNLYQKSGSYANLKREIINIKIDEIINELGLHVSDDPYAQLDMCCKVQKYLTMNNYYDDTMIDEKRGDSLKEIYYNDLYEVLIYNRAICTSNSAEFKEILSKVGIDVKSVFVAADNNESHMCNIVNLGGDYYYFDPTLEIAIYDSDIYDHNDVLLFCAGMGKEDYEQYYKPIGIMDDNFGSEILPMPNNMANSSIPFEVINNSIDTIKVKAK